MTSISSNSSTPLPFVQRTLQRDVAAGSVSSADETALTAAIGDIASQLQGGTTSTSTTTTNTSASTPSTSMKDRVDGLIDDQVSSGKLTSDQASELKGVFAQAHAPMHGAHGHHGGGGGALDSLLASLTSQSSTDTTTDPVTGTSVSSTTAATSASSTNALETSASTAIAAMEAFLNQFKAAISSNSTYAANGQSTGTPSSILVNSIG